MNISTIKNGDLGINHEDFGGKKGGCGEIRVPQSSMVFRWICPWLGIP